MIFARKQGKIGYKLQMGQFFSNMNRLFLLQRSGQFVYYDMYVMYICTRSAELINFNFIERFKEIWGYPNCCGSIDGKHCRVVKFDNAGSTMWNYKSHHSVVLLAVVDAEYRCV